MQTITGTQKIGSYKGVEVLFDWDDIGINYEKKQTMSSLKTSVRRMALLISSLLFIIIFFLEFSSGRIPSFKPGNNGLLEIVILLLFLVILVSALTSFPRKKKFPIEKKSTILINKLLSSDSIYVLNTVYKSQASYIDEVFVESITLKDPQFTRIISSELKVKDLSETIGIVEYNNKREWIEYLLMNSLRLAIKTDIHTISPKILFLAYLDGKNASSDDNSKID